ncbi:thermonuclease family protein [Paenibacillus sp. IB182496]|uniref:Thermonuclease family protein n=1 Tax=Paenibacillus sabuli TaxID=2772509 RepID=A0A927GSE3_9BACL|nr:thermonuclease family protein [Paenibacillus sabuli]
MDGDSKRKRYRAAIIAPIWLLLALLASGCGQIATTAAPAGDIAAAYPELEGLTAESGKVERVIDGDTFVLEGGARVRLIGVNTPEISGKAEYYGQEAAAYARQRLDGASVRLVKDTGDTDRYGRLLRYVFVGEEARMFNEELVLAGYASVMTIQPNVRLADRFVEAERSARAAESGLWGGEQEGSAAAADSGADDAGTADGSPRSSACEDPRVKGNINSKRERIYHVPGSRYYEQTVPEELFCTAEEAEAAGFRAPKG